jgi:hypothetical protein
MAKATGPLFSMDASGGFGGALVFGKWKGRNTVRQLVKPANPQSAGQELARNRVRVVGAAQAQINDSVQVRTGQTQRDKVLLQANAPSGQAWNGYLSKSIIGAGGLSYTEARTAYAALTAPQKTAWDTAAGAVVPAIPAVAQTSAGGVSATPITRGEVFYIQQYGLFKAGLVNTAPAGVPPTYA